MMALRLLPIIQVIIILFTPSMLAYQLYGTTDRYSRSNNRRVATPSWSPYQTVQRYPVNYYELYPYSQTYPDEYYTQDSYPIYYPPARTSKYEVYQAVLPYYYQDRPIARPTYKYYGYDPEAIADLQEEMIQEAEREEREESQPIGHEIMYENEDVGDDSLDDVNAAFLQNLMMSEMYKESLNQGRDYYDQYPYSDYDDSEGRWDDMKETSRPNSYQEDEDVRELKQLAKPQKQNVPRQQPKKQKISSQDIHWFQKSKNEKKQKNQKHAVENKRSVQTEAPETTSGVGERKPILKILTTVAPMLSDDPRRDVRGQKEEVMMRPATPVRNPFSSRLFEAVVKNGNSEHKRAPSVYDTIKHMLDMEKSLENKYAANDVRPIMKKRIVSSEESLTHQLSVLKKAQ